MQRYAVIKNPDEVYEFNGLVFSPRNANKDESIIVNKGFDCGNVTIELAFSLMNGTKKLGETLEDYFGVIFRYNKIAGEEEYYLLKLDREGVELQLFQRGGRTTVVRVEEKFDLVETVNTYDMKITYVGESITVSIMKDPEMMWRELFSINEPSIHRGAVGFEKKGEVDINVLFFKVRDPRETTIKESIDIMPFVKSID